jgi:hypothetical protein
MIATASLGIHVHRCRWSIAPAPTTLGKAMDDDGCRARKRKIFFIFYLYFNGPPKFCKTIQSLPHGGNHISSCSTAAGAVARRPAMWDGHRDILSWATSAGPSATDHGGSRPATTVPHGARICCLYKVEIQPKMS